MTISAITQQNKTKVKKEKEIISIRVMALMRGWA